MADRDTLRHKAEPRDDLAYRYRVFARFLLKARGMPCDRDACPVCALVDEPLETRDLISPTGHEAIVTADDAADCPRGRFFLDLLARAQRGDGV